MVHADRFGRISPVLLATHAFVWVSAVIVMGIVSYWFSSDGFQPDWIIYVEVAAVMTVFFIPVVIFIASSQPFTLLFDLVFSYLWLAVVVFSASQFTFARSEQAHAVEAFSFIAFFSLLFNIGYLWYLGFGSQVRETLGFRDTQPGTSELPPRV